MRNTPLSEIAIVGAATGAASVGMRPVAEIMFCDFLFVAGDQWINQTAKMRYMFGDQCQLSLSSELPLEQDFRPLRSIFNP